MDQDPHKMRSDAEALFAQLVGEWEGQTRTWFEPGKLAGEATTQATIRSLGPNMVIHEYRGSTLGTPHHGLALFSYDVHSHEYEAAWGDSFHMASNIMVCKGQAIPNGFAVTGYYEVGNLEPVWGWRTEVKLEDGQLALTAFNISPQGDEAKALESLYQRVAD